LKKYLHVSIYSTDKKLTARLIQLAGKKEKEKDKQPNNGSSTSQLAGLYASPSLGPCAAACSCCGVFVPGA